jgi:hypothetical protein
MESREYPQIENGGTHPFLSGDLRPKWKQGIAQHYPDFAVPFRKARFAIRLAAADFPLAASAGVAVPSSRDRLNNNTGKAIMAEEQRQDTQKARRMLEQQAERESLSFQSLVEEYGDVIVPPSPPSGDIGNRNTLVDAPTEIVPNDSVADGSLLDRESLFMGGTVMGDVLPEARRRQLEQDMRVLGASGGKKTPIWLQAFFLGGLSLLLLLPIVGGSGFVMFQPWYSYMVIFLAAVTAFWAVYGLIHEEEPKERLLCLIGLGMAVAAIAAAWLTRAPPAPY